MMDYTIDFHSHILPGIDDGAKTVEDSLNLIRAEMDQGIKTIVLTPHYYPERISYQSFLERRQHAYDKLTEAVKEANLPVDFQVAAEVRFSLKLLSLDLMPLCVSGTRVLLIEFSNSGTPHGMKEFFYRIIADGFIPVLVHAERYLIKNDSNIIYDLVNAGVLIQANIDDFFDKSLGKKTRELMAHNCVHLLGSDTHSIDKRPPYWDKGLSVLKKKFTDRDIQILQNNAEVLLSGRGIIPDDPVKFKKGLFGS